MGPGGSGQSAHPQNDPDTSVKVQVRPGRTRGGHSGWGNWNRALQSSVPVVPVTAILHYIEARGTHPGLFFLDSSKKPVTKPWFIEQIRTILTSIGVAQDQYCGHSFRIGAATTAAMAGVEDSVLQTLGRWHSSAFTRYVRMPKEQLAALSATLARLNPSPNVRHNFPQSLTP